MDKKCVANATCRKDQFVPNAADPVKCFFPQNTFVNSWFYIGRSTVEEHELVFLFHLMSGTIGKMGIINTVVSILDQTTGFYESKDTVVKSLRPVVVKKGEVTIQTGFAKMEGNLEKDIKLEAALENCSLNVLVHPVGNVIFNGGTGYFPLLKNKRNYQYSCPEMTMDGTITIEGKGYEIRNGSCWFDRQYNSPELKDIANLKDYNPKWMWMGICLDNGKFVSLWEILPENGIHYCFATILHADGTQTVCQIPSAVKRATEIWHSEKTGQNYPTLWQVEIPDFNVELTVKCEPKQQEIVSQMATLNKYEAESRVTGTYQGEAVQGTCCVELLGTWK